MDLSYKEKSLMASLAATLLVFGWYFTHFFSSPSAWGNDAFTFADLLTPIVLVVILEIIIQSFLAGANKQLEDERDVLIAATSYKGGYFVLSIGIWLLLGQLSTIGTGSWFAFSERPSTAMMAHLLLLTFILAEVTNFVTQLYHYRRGS